MPARIVFLLPTLILTVIGSTASPAFPPLRPLHRGLATPCVPFGATDLELRDHLEASLYPHLVVGVPGSSQEAAIRRIVHLHARALALPIIAADVEFWRRLARLKYDASAEDILYRGPIYARYLEAVPHCLRARGFYDGFSPFILRNAIRRQKIARDLDAKAKFAGKLWASTAVTDAIAYDFVEIIAQPAMASRSPARNWARLMKTTGLFPHAYAGLLIRAAADRGWGAEYPLHLRLDIERRPWLWGPVLDSLIADENLPGDLRATINGRFRSQLPSPRSSGRSKQLLQKGWYGLCAGFLR